MARRQNPVKNPAGAGRGMTINPSIARAGRMRNPGNLRRTPR